MAGMTSKGIKREATCELAFDSRSSHAPEGNDNAQKPIGASRLQDDYT